MKKKRKLKKNVISVFIISAFIVTQPFSLIHTSWATLSSSVPVHEGQTKKSIVYETYEINEKTNNLKEIQKYEPNAILIKFQDDANRYEILENIENDAKISQAKRVFQHLDVLEKNLNNQNFTKSAKKGHSLRKKTKKSLTQIYSEKVAQKFSKRKNRSSVNHKTPNLDNIYKLVFENNIDVKKMCQELLKKPGIIYATPNYLNFINFTPNDPYFHSQGAWGQDYDDLYGLKSDKMNLELAWDFADGTGTLVAVIDTGVDYAHEDLSANMWTNSGEIPGNGIDDEGNGYIDDFYGYDFHNNDSDPIDDHFHGTHCAGTIAATGNNSMGIVGVSPMAKVMAIKGLGLNGGFEDNLVNCIYYATNNGADVLSNSWGRSGTISPVMADAIDYAYSLGVVSVFAAGNSNQNVSNFSPAHYKKVIAVSATDWEDRKASFSNYGQRIDVSAPGVNIVSCRLPGADPYGDLTHTIPQGDPSAKYYRCNGTSMACPHISGVVCLLIEEYSDWSIEQLRGSLNHGIDNIDLLNPGYEGFLGLGRSDAHYALTAIPVPDILFHETDIDDQAGNNNGFLDPGETVSLIVTLKNTWADAENVSATLTSADPLVSIDPSSATANFNNIECGQMSDNTASPYIISADPSTLRGHNFLFTLNIIADNGYVNTVDFTVAIPTYKLTYYGYTLDDSMGNGNNIIDPNETFHLAVLLKNTGIIEAQNINMVIASSDPDVTIINNSSDYGNILLGQVATNASNPFIIKTSASFSSNSIHLAGTLTGNEGYQTNINIYIVAGIQRITSQVDKQYRPCTWGDNIVWESEENGNYDIYLYNLKTQQKIQITNTPDVNEYSPWIWEDKIVYDRERKIYLYDLSTGTETLISDINDTFFKPKLWGNYVVYTRLSCSNPVYFQVILYNIETGVATPITNNQVYALDVSIWKNSVVYRLDKSGNSIPDSWDIYLYDIETGQETQLTNSPDDEEVMIEIWGKRITWVRHFSPEHPWSTVFALDIETGIITQLTGDDFLGQQPSIYENFVVWQDWRNQNYNGDLYMYNFDTGEETLIVSGFASHNPHIWKNKIVWDDTIWENENRDIYMAEIDIVTQPPLATQTIKLYAEQENIISFNVKPDDMNMNSILKLLIEKNLLIVMEDDSGGIINPDKNIYTIRKMKINEGYLIKVKENVKIDVKGTAVELPVQLVFNEGWNLMGFPLDESREGLEVFESLISQGILIEVKDENDNILFKGPSPQVIFQSEQQNFELEPNEGYHVTVSESTILTIE